MSYFTSPAAKSTLKFIVAMNNPIKKEGIIDLRRLQWLEFGTNLATNFMLSERRT